ncbi:hypothetical protein O7599_08960 [Streptomyces sp. WMMC500]|uniref:hypothetical protein n=1 Tax=Streptomyces sp. WMMC500 TaxID=3015154 RepID=UPI00248AB12A|nr:hypothetical protein [Streptomyces sp. WMMC500]WBB62642.1 hypothetical protein O7599_08960 [Streptomyces sp. WMMC500]
MPLPAEDSPTQESVPGRSASPRPIPGPRPVRPRGGSRSGPGGRGPGATAPGARPAPAGGQGRPAAGPQLQLIPATPDGAVDAADEAVDLLLESGRAPAEILVLTTGEPHPWAAHELSFGEDGYWAQEAAGDDVFYAAAAAAERLARRPVVVVAVNGGGDRATAEALPAAMTRAAALLILCGDADYINGVLGVSA